MNAIMNYCNDVVMTEAFWRAQMRGRVFPQLCDFPPSVSAEVAERLYLAPLRSLCMGCNNPENSRNAPPHHRHLKNDTGTLQRGPLEVTEYSQETDTASFLTSGGDAWAAALLLEEVL